ncbi:YidB family protein [Lichenifustis flavocetrariae]|uniref:YidB family protein n=1 Tax=Lichenifustis flavocetrariae TaxID=2949735 RepID=A0AA41Z2N5_9HYPH|nr:YidB family protein [Lichenifustis flavocetrariae]MCW6508172.1 YidB family protein [Lichenifustis flavocetrariae]
MGILENSIGAMFGRGSGDNDGPSFGGAPYAPLATALIGLLAAKAMSGGFGNLGGLFGGGQAAQPAPQQGQMPQGEPQGGGGLLGGLGGLLHQFQQNGMGNVAQSWVGSGHNEPVNPGQVQQAIGPDMIRELAQKTGMSEQQIAQQLSQELPDIINKLTPQGRLPSHDEASSWLKGGNPLQG